MVSVIKSTMGSARGGSRRGRPKKSDNDSNDDGAEHSSRVVSSGVTERAHWSSAVETLPKSKATKKSKAATAATNASAAELELPAVSKSETHETVEGVQSASSSPSPHQHTKKSSSAEMPSPGLSPIQNNTEKEATKETTSSSSSSIALAHQGIVSLPVVTRATRRETFATTKAPKKKERKVKRSTGENSPQSSTSSSGVDETIMDLFAPPQSTRTRSRPSSSSATQQAKTVRPPEITITTSSSSSLSKAEAAGGKSQQKQAQTSTSSSTPSKFAATPSTKRKPRNSPKTPADTKKTGRGSAERKALSTTNKKQYAAAGTLVHLPRPSPYRYGSHFDPFISFHKSPPWEIDVMQKSTESAPAKMPVSTSIVDWLPHHIFILIGCRINSSFFCANDSNSRLFLTSLSSLYLSTFSDFSTCNSTSRG